MKRYKAAVILSWEVEADEQQNDTTVKNLIREQLSEVIDCSAYSLEKFKISSFQCHPQKTTTRPVSLKEYSAEEVFMYMDILHQCFEHSKMLFYVNDKEVKISLGSRYEVFLRNRYCVVCGLEGTKMILSQQDNKTPHFNLYGLENGELILMTRDHIIPRSKGGPNTLENLQTMCTICNNLKSNTNLTTNDCRSLRAIYRNRLDWTKKEFNRQLNTMRQKLVRSS